jgi:hypothetical protein
LWICGTVGLISVGPVGAQNTFEGVYTGKRVRTKGTDPTCPREDAVTIIIRDQSLTITHSTLRNFTTGFDPREDGSFGQVYSDGGGGIMSIQGRIVGDILDADESSDTCEHHWHLKRG